MAGGVDGMLVVDKPAGVSSAAVVARVKRVTGAGKAGHAGTLDPFATGVLVCCLGKATRLAGFLLEGDKVYRGVLRLGAATDTQDVTGKVVRTGDAGAVTEEEIRRVFSAFTGTQRQRPPAYSALKHRGVPLYKLARAGRPVQKAERTVQVKQLEILDIRLPDVQFDVSCSAGTYIRTLCADMGERLGCGGHLASLRRLASSGFAVDQALTPEVVEEKARAGRLGEVLMGMTDALSGMPRLRADDRLTRKIENGVPLFWSDFGASSGRGAGLFYRVVDGHGRLLAVVSSNSGGERLTYRCVLSTGS
jgi:tRNA pseudouridine55 synthase